VSAFDLYAAYYDLLYGDKDYGAEVDYVRSLIGDDSRRVLELGCGTGGHAFALARRGFVVHGVDLSTPMVTRAQRRLAASPTEVQARLRFQQGDARTYRDGEHYEAVLSLFHVMSYQTHNADLEAAMATARAHLAPGGRFVFDFWYGPAVLSDRPRHVVKEVSDDRIDVRRETAPSMFINDNRVDVRFDVEIRARDGGDRTTVQEVHPMRYLFLPELDALLQRTGFERSGAWAWMSDQPPSDHSWYACVAAIAR
jgi:SAM-dependent methyltransferase